MTELTLETARLELRPFSPGDLDRLFSLYGEAEVMAIRKLGVQSRAQTAEHLEEMVASWMTRGLGMWSVFESASETFIGECGLRSVGPKDPAIELSYGLLPQYWGQGYAREASRAAVDFGFSNAGLEEIVAIARADNVRSRRILEWLGMTLVRQTDGPHGGIVRYNIAATVWRAQRANTV